MEKQLEGDGLSPVKLRLVVTDEGVGALKGEKSIVTMYPMSVSFSVLYCCADVGFTYIIQIG